MWCVLNHCILLTETFNSLSCDWQCPVVSHWRFNYVEVSGGQGLAFIGRKCKTILYGWYRHTCRSLYLSYNLTVECNCMAISRKIKLVKSILQSLGISLWKRSISLTLLIMGMRRQENPEVIRETLWLEFKMLCLGWIWPVYYINRFL